MVNICSDNVSFAKNQKLSTGFEKPVDNFYNILVSFRLCQNIICSLASRVFTWRLGRSPSTARS